MLLINRQALWIKFIIGLICFFIFLNLELFHQFYTKNQYDKITQCSENIKEKHIFIIDQSSLMSIQTQTEILSRIKQQINQIKKHDFVALYIITPQSLSQLRPIFQACKVQEDFNENLIKSVKVSLYRDLKPQVTTPLAEILLDINLSHQNMNAKYSKLYIYSDLLQKSPHLSLFESIDSMQAIQQFKKSRAGSEQRPTFINTFVHLNIIPRANLSEQLVKNRDGFWSWFFGDMRGTRSSYGLERHDLPGSFK